MTWAFSELDLDIKVPKVSGCCKKTTKAHYPLVREYTLSDTRNDLRYIPLSRDIGLSGHSVWVPRPFGNPTEASWYATDDGLCLCSAAGQWEGVGFRTRVLCNSWIISAIEVHIVYRPLLLPLM